MFTCSCVFSGISLNGQFATTVPSKSTLISAYRQTLHYVLKVSPLDSKGNSEAEFKWWNHFSVFRISLYISPHILFLRKFIFWFSHERKLWANRWQISTSLLLWS
jgi:hypothetical protein